MKKLTWVLILIWLLAFFYVSFNIMKLVYANSDLEEQLNLAHLDMAELEYKISSSGQEFLGEFVITHYDDCVACCGKTDGITKSGAKVCEGVTVAVDPSVIPLGSYIYIEGIGYRVAQDTGGAIKGNKIDVYVHSHEKALELGRLKNLRVWRMS